MNINKIVADLNKISADATDLRIDVLMDKLQHRGRTILADTEFNGVRDALQYAIDRTTANSYTINRKSGNRLNGQAYVVYTVVLN